MGTERTTEEALRDIINAWVEKYPDEKILTEGQIYGLLNDYGDDADYILSAIEKMPRVRSDGRKVDYTVLKRYCNNGWVADKTKAKPTREVHIGYEEDQYGNLTPYAQHRKIMDTEWHVPVIDNFDPRNPIHLQIQFDHLLRTGQIGEREYNSGMIGIKIMTDEIDLMSKIHVGHEESGDDSSIPF